MGNRYNDQLEQGLGGSSLIADTTERTGNFGGIKVVNDAVIDSWTATNMDDYADLEGVTLYAGDYIPVKFTDITLSSGAVIVYKRYKTNY